LGRGLGALLGAEPRASASRGGGTLPLALMQAGSSQPRREIQRQPLDDLAASIKANGVIQPIVVRPLPPGTLGDTRYEIVAGERRWQAAKLAGLADIPAIVRELSDSQAVAVALIENIQREELTPVEEARAFKRLIEEFSLTHAEVADAVGRSRAAVSNLLRLLELPAEVMALIGSKSLSMGHARALLGLEEEADRVRLGVLVAERGCSVRETEALVRKALAGEEATRHRASKASMPDEILKSATVQVRMRQKTDGSGRLIVEFADPGSRDAIVQAIKACVSRELG
jgi:ParB family transcriptional regulator, chromosome partitioning protein